MKIKKILSILVYVAMMFNYETLRWGSDSSDDDSIADASIGSHDSLASSSSHSDSDMEESTVGSSNLSDETFVDEYGKSIEDLFSSNYKEVWMALPMNSPVVMTKGMLTNRAAFYELDCRTTCTEELMETLKFTSVPIKVHLFDGTITNFIDSEVVTYTSKMEVSKSSSVDHVMSNILLVLQNNLVKDENKVYISKEVTKHIESLFIKTTDLSILKVNFFPTTREVSIFTSMGFALMVPGGKVMVRAILPEVIKAKPMARNSDKRITIPPTTLFTKEAMTTATQFLQYSFTDSSMSTLKRMDTMVVDANALAKMFKKVRTTNVEVTETDQRSIADTITTKSKITITQEWVSKYLKVRSSIMETALAEHLDIGWPNKKGDIGPWTGERPIDTLYAELKGLKMLTPDLIICKKTCRNLKASIATMKLMLDKDLSEDNIYLVDVKVSDYGSTLNVTSTTSKYVGFCNVINKKFEELKVPIRAETYVVEFVLNDTAKMSEMFSTCLMNKSSVRAKFDMIQTHWDSTFKRNKDYKNLKSAAERSESSDFDPFLMDSLFGSYKLLDPDFMFKPGFTKRFTTLEETEVGNEIMSFNMSEEEATSRISEYIDAMFNSMVSDASPEFKEVTNRLKEPSDLTKAINDREKAISERTSTESEMEPITEKRAFKCPFMVSGETPVNVKEMTEIFGMSRTKTTKDSTLIVHSNTIKRMGLCDEFWYPNRVMSDAERNASKAGYNFNRSVVDDLEAEMREISCRTTKNEELNKMVDETMQDLSWSESVKTSVKTFLMTNQFENLMYLQKLMQELVQIESRRHNYIKKEFHNFSSKKFSVFRTMGDFVIEVKNGPKLSRNNNLRFRVWTKEKSAAASVSKEFHRFHKVNGTQFYATKYLSIQPIDLVTYLNVFESSMMLTVGFVEKYLETNMNTAPTDEDFFSLSVRLFQLLDHRNNTSMASQLSRYLLVGGTSIFADRISLVSEIGEDVIRSKFQMYTIGKQLDWTKKMSNLRADFLKDAFIGQADKENLDNRMKLPSFYSNSSFYIGMLLDEIYFCNLMDPNFGTRKHMTEATFKKMAKMEILWRSKIMTPENIHKMRGLVKTEFWGFSKETLFFFDRAVVYSTMMNLMSEVSMNQVMRTFLPLVFEPLTELMTLKSSVMETAGMTIYDTGTSLKEVRSTAFETQKRIMDQFHATTILDVVNLFNHFDYYFAEFPKPQIGGPREILIQDIFTRAKARMLENFFNNLNKQFDSEMTSNSEIKYVRQANMDHILENSMKAQAPRPITISLANNKDHSKWAPGANVIQYCYMVTPLDIGNRIKKFLVTAIMAYATAKIGMPKQMLDTAMNLGMNKIKKFKEMEVAWVYSEFFSFETTPGMMVIKAGWPQGMLQFTSSTFHVVEKHLMKLAWRFVAMKMDVNWSVMEMISSDDTTDYMIMQMDNISEMFTFISQMLAIGYMVGKSFNMHENKKKSNLQLVIKEFNSIFQVGKTVKTAMIKFLVKSVAIPDFTYPEEAVKELISMEQMLLANGATMNMLTACRASHRRTLRAAYNQDSYSKELAEKLECSVDELPVELGFLPRTNVMASCIYGAAVYNYTAKPKKVREFLDKLYSKEKANLNFFSVDKTSYMSDMAFKEKLKLPMKLDKQMKLMKERIGATNSVVNEIAKKRFDIMLDGKNSAFTMTYAIYKMMSINVRFSIDTGFLYRAHSMVRANQINSDKSALSLTSTKKVNTITDFVDMIMDNPITMPEAISNHPMREVMEMAINITDEVTEKVSKKEVMVMESTKMPKFRVVNFCNTEMYPILSSMDMYRIFRTHPSKRNKRDTYKAETMEKYYKLTSKFSESSLVQTLAENNNLSAMTISSIFENMSSMMKSFTMTIPFEEPASTNAAKNFQSILRNRMFAARTIVDFDLDNFSKMDMLRMAEVYDSAAALGLLTTDISQMPFIAKAMKEDNLIYKVDTSRDDLTNIEKMVTIVNSWATDLASAPTFEKALEVTPETVYFSKAVVTSEIFGKMSATVKSWVTNTFQMITVVTKEEYLIILWDPEVNSPLLSDILSKESRYLKGKKEMEVALATNPEKEEFKEFQINTMKNMIVETDTMLDVSLSEIKGCWSVMAMDVTATIFLNLISFNYRVFVSKIPNEFPILTDRSIEMITDPKVKIKLRAVKRSDLEIHNLEASEKRTLCNLWTTDKEMADIEALFRSTIDVEMEEMAMMMAEMENFAVDTRAFTGMLAAEFSSMVQISPEEENIATFEAMATVFEEAAETSIFSKLMEISLDALGEDKLEGNEEVNTEMIRRRTVESLTVKVRKFIVSELDIPIASVRSMVTRKISFLTSNGVAVDKSKLIFDLLKSLHARVVLKMGRDNVIETMLLCTKVFLSMVFEKDNTFVITSHTGATEVAF